MTYQQEITLELNSNTAYTTVGAKQGDAYTREIIVHITADGIPWQIPSGVVASYRVRKPDGMAVWNEAIIRDNTVVVTLSEETLSVAGRAYADIILYTNSGRAEILSTVSFIIIIMSSPNISEAVASSNEFGYIQQVVDDANAIISESESWAIGTRSGVPVLGDSFTSEITTGGGFTYSIDKDVFRSYVGLYPGETIAWYLTYISSLVGWIISRENYQAQNVTPEEVGLTILSGIPNVNSVITVTVSDADKQWHNNSKYWSTAAQTAEESINNSDAKVIATLDYDQEAEVEKVIVDDAYVLSQPSGYDVSFDQDDFIEAVGGIVGEYSFYYTNTTQGMRWTLDGQVVYLVDYGITNVPANPTENDTIVIHYSQHGRFNFSIPRGYTGDTNFMTLAINPDDGYLYMYRPSNLVDRISFEIINDFGEEDDGYLQVILQTEV